MTAAAGVETRLRDHKLLLATCILLGIMYLPREIAASGPPTAPLIAALAAVLAVRYRAFKEVPTTAVDVVLALLGFWIAARLLVIGPLEGEGLDVQFAFREIAALVTGMIMYRLGRRQEVRTVIITGLAVTAVLLLAVTAYQLAVGLPSLLARGYTTSNGYYYYTIDGTYRPFGLFNGPTVFGGYLAMTGVFLTLAWRRWWLTVGIVVGVLLTQTRSAWIAVMAAALVLALGSPPVRRQLAVIAVPVAGAVVALSIIFPSVTAFVADRALSATQQGDTSRVTRTELWAGVWEAVWARNPAIGRGSADWLLTMSAHAPAVVVDLGHPHSNHFQVLYQYGLVGLGMFVVLLTVLVLACRPRPSAPYAAASLGAVVVFVVDSTFNNGMSSLSYFVTLLLIVGVGTEAAQPVVHDLRRTSSSLPLRRPPGPARPADEAADRQPGGVGGHDDNGHRDSVEQAEGLQSTGTGSENDNGDR